MERKIFLRYRMVKFFGKSPELFYLRDFIGDFLHDLLLNCISGVFYPIFSSNMHLVQREER